MQPDLLTINAGISKNSNGNGKQEKTGVILINLGTPEATDYFSMRRYLKQFLSDPRVIEKSPIIWWPILNLIILSLRPQKSGKAYDEIWNRERNESPLKTITRAQATGLAQSLQMFINSDDDTSNKFSNKADTKAGNSFEHPHTSDTNTSYTNTSDTGFYNTNKQNDLVVTWAMRYGQPAIETRINELCDLGVTRLLIVPLYPQYSTSTTASVADEVFRSLSKMRKQPALRIAPPYYAKPSYIKALANSIANRLEQLNFVPEKIIASFHGIPVEYCQRGDWYCQHCHQTIGLLREALPQAIADRVILTFQSRFGKTPWLQPYTDETIAMLATKMGVKSLLMIMPGFASDCVETLEEIAIGSREVFMEHGGENFALVSCLNDSEDSIKMLKDIVVTELSGWRHRDI